MTGGAGAGAGSSESAVLRVPSRGTRQATAAALAAGGDWRRTMIQVAAMIEPNMTRKEKKSQALLHCCSCGCPVLTYEL